MAGLSPTIFPLAVGAGLFLLHLIFFRSWPPAFADILGSALLGLLVGIGVYVVLRFLGKRNGQ